MLRRLELSDAAHDAIIARCKARGSVFMSTPFDSVSLERLVCRVNVKEIKAGSGEVTEAPRLVAAHCPPLPLSLPAVPAPGR